MCSFRLSCLISAAQSPAASAPSIAPGDNSHRDTLPTDHGTTAIRYRAAPIAHGAAANCYGTPAIRCTPAANCYGAAANCYGRQGISRNTRDGESGDRSKQNDSAI